MTFPRILAALAAAFLGLVPVGAGAQTISGGGGSVPLTAACVTQSVAQLCFDATNTLAQRNGVNAQAFRVYNTYSSGTADEWVSLDFTTFANEAELSTAKNGTGNQRALSIWGLSTSLRSGTTGTVKWTVDTSGNLIAGADNSYDIGASSATRPRNVFVAQGITAGGVITTANILTTGVFLVANLPSCTGRDGSRAAVSDATVSASGNFGAAVAGSGANHVPVYCDGTSWKIG